MIAVAHLLAITCYVGAAATAAAPFARRMPAPVRSVVALLALGIVAHVGALAYYTAMFGQPPLTGIGPALSFASLLVAASLLLVEVVAGDVSLTLVAAPLAAAVAACAFLLGLYPGEDLQGARGLWLTSHIALSFTGIASFATAAAAGAMYLVERRELKSHRFGAIFRFFPPLETLDRVNHVAVVAGWLMLTVGVALAATYAVAYRVIDVPKIVWACAAWMAVTSLTVGRVLGGWRARRAAVVSSLSFVLVVALYVAFRVAAPEPGHFL
jgi:HemX protein